MKIFGRNGILKRRARGFALPPMLKGCVAVAVSKVPAIYVRPLRRGQIQPVPAGHRAGHLFRGGFFLAHFLVADAIFIYVLFRMFSRNHAARQREYYGFLRFWTPIEKWFTFQRTRFRERNTYKYFRCPQCKQKLRAPRGRGKSR